MRWAGSRGCSHPGEYSQASNPAGDSGPVPAEGLASFHMRDVMIRGFGTHRGFLEPTLLGHGETVVTVTSRVL